MARPAEPPKPMLVLLFERIAAIMELDEGLTRLELEFDGGSLRRWSTNDGRNGHEGYAASIDCPERPI
jgi:hypothetical protein